MNGYLPVTHGEKDTQIELSGIPFSLEMKNGIPESYRHDKTVKVHTGVPVQMAFFTGMATNAARASEWWGSNESAYNHSVRVFIGDCLGYLDIFYHGGPVEIVPLIFGMNVWNYELYFPKKDNEPHLETFGGPYNEPFASDEKAQALLERSLCLNELDQGKALKYIMALRLRDRPVEAVGFRTAEPKTAGVYISAMTFLKCGCPCPDVRVLEWSALQNRGWQYDLDCLARRLYQFKDDIPARVAPLETTQVGPKLCFAGSNVAEIFTNVVQVNLLDMATDKVTEDGMMHTSSSDAPSFGMYVGMGTFANAVGAYRNQIWSRDVGRLLMELCAFGAGERVKPACDRLMAFLYDPSLGHMQPNWKRVANASQFDKHLQNYAKGKENDGHAALMLAIYNAFRTGHVDKDWMEYNKTAVFDAADWFCWQIDHPDKSHFDTVLHSESEASTQQKGGYDLFSNTFSFYALTAFSRLSTVLDWEMLEQKCATAAAVLMRGIMDTFVFDHPRFGRILVDNTYDCWTYEYKRFALLFLLPDLFGFDIEAVNPEWSDLCVNTFAAQKSEYFNPYSGRQMGYGQGYLTQTCALLDAVDDFTACVEAAAFFCYHQYDHSYIVPEGVICHGSGRYWFRNCDLGNAVQQAEIVKIARLILGVDDVSVPGKLSLIPRLPDSFTGFTATGYPVITEGGKPNINISYGRTEHGYRLCLDCEEPVFLTQVRFGPFTGPVHSDLEVKTIMNRGYVIVPVNAAVQHWSHCIDGVY